MSKISHEIVRANKENIPKLKEFLKSLDLVFEDIEEHIENFLIIKKNSSIIGCSAVENYEKVGLLRSVGVDPNYQGQGLGKLITNHSIGFAKDLGIKELYLLTDTAKDFFKKFGFEVVSRETVDNQIKQTYEYRKGCPETSNIMKKMLQKR